MAEKPQRDDSRKPNGVPRNRRFKIALRPDRLPEETLANGKRGCPGKERHGGRRRLNLKEHGANNQIKSITYCADTYDGTTKTGDTHQFWQFNVRFKFDSSENGPTNDIH